MGQTKVRGPGELALVSHLSAGSPGGVVCPLGLVLELLELGFRGPQMLIHLAFLLPWGPDA